MNVADNTRTHTPIVDEGVRSRYVPDTTFSERRAGTTGDPVMGATFGEQLAEAVRRVGTGVVVGLDPREDLLPESLRKKTAGAEESRPRVKLASAIEEFCKVTIETVKDLVVAVKLQTAYFEVLGPVGFECQRRILTFAREAGLITILDAKRADIAATAEAYAAAALADGEAAVWQAAAVTVNPYMGPDSLEPFLRYAREADKGVFVLVRTSNPGAAELQDRKLEDGRTVAELVASWVERWAEETAGPSGLGAVGAVVGATAGEMLGRLREAMPHAWLLVPGFGAQGGSPKDVLPAFRSDGLGALITSSRAILAGAREAEAAGRSWETGIRDRTVKMIQEVKDAVSARQSSTV